MSVVICSTLLACNAPPLDDAAADALLQAGVEPAELYCQVDVGIRDGLARSRKGAEGMRRVSECLVALERKGLVEARCLASEGDVHAVCRGLEVTFEQGAARVVDDVLEVRCGTATARARAVERAGDVAWISVTTALEASPHLVGALETCRAVPAYLPATKTRIARWRDGGWQLDPP